MSEYDPVFSAQERRRDFGSAAAEDEEAVRAAFVRAGQGYLVSPLSWLVWAVVLPGAALLTERYGANLGLRGLLLLWSGAVLAGGVVEGALLWRSRARRAGGSGLGSWAMTAQGNLSLVGLGLSVAVAWIGQAWLLPGLWLLLIGHSFFTLGALASRPLRACGVAYQLGGAAALWPGGRALVAFAVATAIANLGMAVALLFAPREQPR